MECWRQGNAAAVSMQNRVGKNQAQLAVTSCLGQKAKSLYPNEFNPSNDFGKVELSTVCAPICTHRFLF